MEKRRLSVCPDCPAVRNGVLGALVDAKRNRCTLQCVAVPARHPLPSGWFERYGLAIVRRGIVIRQRIDPSGLATAIDAIGPGGAAPLGEAEEANHGGYAADDALVCLVPKGPLMSAVNAGAPTAGEVVRLHAAALERVERIAEARCRHTAIARVASLLCALSDCLSAPRRLELVPGSLQQRDLAALLALRHESVCRVLGTLERRRWLLRNDGGIRLLDRAQLQAV